MACVILLFGFRSPIAASGAYSRLSLVLLAGSNLVVAMVKRVQSIIEKRGWGKA